MRGDFVFVTEDEDKEVVAQLLAKHRLLALPVLDRKAACWASSAAPIWPTSFSRKPAKTS